MLHAHHIVISGFLQDRGHLAGCDRVLAMLDRFRAPGVRVDYREWNSNWRAEAAFISRHRAPRDARGRDQWPTVCIYAYSWGVGWGAAQLAWHLAAQQIPIYGLVACDGVYRHSYRFGNWRAFLPGSRIRLPDTVQRCVAFHQAHTWPKGHRITIGGREVKRRPLTHVELNGNSFRERATHLNVDECRQWHVACEEMAEAGDAATRRGTAALTNQLPR